MENTMKKNYATACSRSIGTRLAIFVSKKTKKKQNKTKTINNKR